MSMLSYVVLGIPPVYSPLGVYSNMVGQSSMRDELQDNVVNLVLVLDIS